MNPKDIVKDWNGFERFVAHLHEDGEVTVSHDRTLTGNSGATRQIDVVVEHQKGPYKYLTLIECKYWKESVKREQIDVLHASMVDLNASKGVFFTTKGYQRGAQKYAESRGITLYKIRDLTDEEWGLPGKIIDIYLQILQPTVKSLIPNVIGFANADGNSAVTEVHLPLSLGTEQGTCPIFSTHQRKFATLEALLDYYISDSMKQVIERPFLINSGEDCIRYLAKPVILDFKEPLIIKPKGTFIMIDKIRIEIGIKLDQSRIYIDRSEKMKYALAVYDCITKETFAVSEHADKPFTNWTLLSQKDDSTNADIVNKGSVISIILKGYFSPEEMDGLVPTKFKFA
ncbi:restriction endonuclease [Pseudomonas kurunegalensis]|uniref:restriction endonuclease n=1 Tax=Pseudomonas kurunegalensis TaxID=485880 RepID=UPI001CDBFFBC|nr:restriction endonuclease [Pseudomonas kurunegalensis]MCA4078856.1 restriction endonuclease [Pseudomonas kurunegalensis]